MLHKDAVIGDIHVIHNWAVANVAARNALSVSSADVGKIAKLDDGTFHLLTSASPVTWLQLGSGGGGTPSGRETLTAARTYYVSPTGLDTNNGLTSGAAFLTVQKAIDVISGTLDTSTHQVTIQLADGTYTGLMAVKPTLGSLPILIKGNTATPASVHVNVTGTCLTADGPSSYIRIEDMKLSGTTYCLWATFGGKIEYGNIVFGAASRHINAQNYGTIVAMTNYAIDGGGTSHIGALGGTVQVAGRTVTITGTPAFSVAYAVVSRVGLLISFSNTYSGSATGKRYEITGNSILDANGGATTLLPGNTAGTTATGGQYI